MINQSIAIRIKGLIIFRGLKSRLLVYLLCISLLALIPGLLLSAEKVIINHSVSQQINTSKIRSIFSMRRRTWEDGSVIRVFVLPDNHPTHKQFSKNILGMFPHRLRKSWDRLVFTGTGQAPETVESEQEMRQRVSTTPGAIGYLSEENIDATVKTLSDE